MPRQPLADPQDRRKRLRFALIGGLAFGVPWTVGTYVMERDVWMGPIAGLVFALTSYFMPDPRFWRLPLSHDTFVKVAFIFIGVIVLSSLAALLITR